MKRFILGIALLGVLVSSGLWAHHMAEGIISDEVWEQIDSRVSEIHNDMLDDNIDLLTVDTTETMGTMRVTEDEEFETIYLESYITVEFIDDSLTNDERMTAVEDLMDVILLESEEMSRLPPGTEIDGVDDLDTRTLNFDVEYIDEDTDGLIDFVEIYMYEPIGTGDAQEVPGEDDTNPPFENRGETPGG